jgi:hypothetical protein
MWEYLHKIIDNYCCYQGDYERDKPSWKHINILGADRWELVAIRPINDQTSMAIFKRPKLGSDHQMGPEEQGPYQDLR